MTSSPSRQGTRLALAILVCLLCALAMPAASLAATTQITGTVTDANDGWPLNGINVDIRYWDSGSSAWLQQVGAGIGVGGQFVTTVPPKTYRIEFSDQSGRYKSEVYHNATSLGTGKDIPVAAGQTVTITEQLTPVKAQIQGSIKDELSGNPAVGIEITAYRWNSGTSTWIETATRQTMYDGAYAFSGLAAGTYRLRFADAGYEWSGAYATEYWKDSATLNGGTSIAVTSGMTAKTCDALIAPIPGIAGTVTALVGGAPIDRAYVMAVDAATHNFKASAFTRSDGTYGLSLPTGSYHVSFEGPTTPDGAFITRYWSNKTSYATADVINVTAGTTNGAKNAALPGQFVSLYGTVKGDTTNSSISGVEVIIYRYDGSSWVVADSTSTYEDGRWAVFGLPADTYRVLFDTNGVPGWIGEFHADKASVGAANNVVYNGINSQQVNATLAHVQPTLNRLSGSDRYECAMTIARTFYDRQNNKGWKGGDWLVPVTDIVLASGEDRAAADPLSASALCAARNAPLLLVSSAKTPSSVKAAAKEIAAANGDVTIWVVGGPVSVPDARVNEVKAAVASAGKSATVKRLATGGDRYDLAAAVARQVWSLMAFNCDVVLVANGADPDKFFDALALSTVSASRRAPILLVKADSVPAATSAALKHLVPDEVVVGGGPATVSNSVVNSLGAERWYGTNRYSTATTIATKAAQRRWLWGSKVAFAAALPDALTGGSAMGREGGALVLLKPTAVPGETGSWIETHDHQELAKGYVLGGKVSVSDPTYNQVKGKLALP